MANPGSHLQSTPGRVQAISNLLSGNNRDCPGALGKCVATSPLVTETPIIGRGPGVSGHRLCDWRRWLLLVWVYFLFAALREHHATWMSVAPWPLTVSSTSS